MQRKTAHVTTGFVLSRLDFGEADRIVTILTPDLGRVSALAKGVRKEKSRLAGGIELFCEISVNLQPGRGDLYAISGARLLTHFSKVLADFERSQAGFELLKTAHAASHDGTGQDMYPLLQASFGALNTPLPIGLVLCWFELRLLLILGHGINLRTAADGSKLSADASYRFSFDDMAFFDHPDGEWGAAHIKLLRLMEKASPASIARVGQLGELLPSCRQLVASAMRFILV